MKREENNMTLSVCFFGESPVKIWGMTCRERMVRVLGAMGGVRIVADLAVLHANAPVLILRADHLIDDRLIHYLAATPDMLLLNEDGGEKTAVAAHVSGSIAHQTHTAMTDPEKPLPPGVRIQTLDSLALSFQEKLRKFDPPFVLPVSADRQRRLERGLFAWSYKGVTDLVTKWVWPHPAQWAVRQCVRLGIQPNHVTLTSLILVVLAGGLFIRGQYGWGLAVAWVMTFLDTVDGKLARVTVTASRFGHYFDHLIDLFSPPVWYMLWGLGLKYAYPGGLFYALDRVIWLMLIGYVAGRLVELTFKKCLGRFGIFCWQPMDSCFRLVTARRNPCLILLTFFTLWGRPDLGLLAVAFWTLLSSVFLLLRLAWASLIRIREGSLTTWFVDARRSRDLNSPAVRWFIRGTPD